MYNCATTTRTATGDDDEYEYDRNNNNGDNAYAKMLPVKLKGLYLNVVVSLF